MSIVDGIKCSFSFTEHEYLQWRLLSSDAFRTWLPVYEDSGEIKVEEDQGNGKWRVDSNKKRKWNTIVREGKFQTYDLILKETNYECLISGKRSRTYRGEISGSLTANHHGGENWRDLSFNQLQQELRNISEGLCLNLQMLKVDNLEPSINVAVPFKVASFVDKNVVAYGTQPFNRYAKSRGKALGRFLELTDKTEIKIYDKAEQYSLPDNMMQFELHFKKMKVLNSIGIYTLADLTEWHKVNQMLTVLDSYFEKILFFDPDISPNNSVLTSIQKTMVERGRAFEYWQDLKANSSNGTYYNRLREFRALSADYGSDYSNKIRQAIREKWNQLMGEEESCTNFPSVPEVSIKWKLEEFAGSVGCKYLQKSNSDCRLSEILNKEVKACSGEETRIPETKNQRRVILRKNREREQQQVNSFYKSLQITLKKLDAA